MIMTARKGQYTEVQLRKMQKIKIGHISNPSQTQSVSSVISRETKIAAGILPKQHLNIRGKLEKNSLGKYGSTMIYNSKLTWKQSSHQTTETLTFSGMAC